MDASPRDTTEPTEQPTQTRIRQSKELHSNPTDFELSVAEKIHTSINQIRRERGMSTLDYDDDLARIAWGHSKDMSTNDYFSHTQPDGDTRTDRYDQAGYSCRVPAGGNTYLTGGENIFRTRYSGFSYSAQEIAERVVQGWMDSPGHRENILTEAWRNEDIGVYRTESGGEVQIYITQNFC